MNTLKTDRKCTSDGTAKNSLSTGLLCEGTIRLVTGQRMLVQTDDENVWATLALAYPVKLTCGDRVLAIGQGHSWYVVGVLQSAKSHTIFFDGDLELQATGSLSLSGLKGVSLKGPSIGLCAERINFTARTLSEKYQSVRRVVKGSVFQRVGKLRTTVKGIYRLKAHRVIQRAERDVSIDGSKINLG